jgi:hypothetical protein
MSDKKYLRPNNQKALYNTAMIILTDLLNGDLDVTKGEVANNLISNANRSFALEIKLAELTKNPIRIIESKNFVEDEK